MDRPRWTHTVGEVSVLETLASGGERESGGAPEMTIPSAAIKTQNTAVVRAIQRAVL